MKILVVTTSIPFPPRHGVELPLCHLIRHLARSHTVDLLVAVRSAPELEEYQARLAGVPPDVHRVDALPVRARPRLRGVLREVLGIAPTFLVDAFDPGDLRRLLGSRHYDVAWVSPIGCIGLLHACRGLGLDLAGKVAIGNNDAKMSLYWDSVRQMFGGHAALEGWRLARALRLPWLRHFERKYLLEADLVHVQTPLERSRSLRLIGAPGAKVRVVDAANGTNPRLQDVRYGGRDTKRVLYLTHLAGGRRRESDWFLKRVWPRVLRAEPEAELWLVGTPPAKGATLVLPPRTTIRGYVEDLAEVFGSVALSVVPTSHGTGWINRIADSLAAGVPVVACPEPLATMPDLRPGVDAMQARTAAAFAEAIVRLLADADLREVVAANAKRAGRRLPTWSETAARIERELEGMCGAASAGRIDERAIR